MARLRPGDPAPDFDVLDIQGRRLTLKGFRNRPLMLSFFREAGCPFCNIRVYELTQQHGYLKREGLEIVAVFRSPEEDIRHYVAHRPRPFLIVSDPEQYLYDLYGIEHSARKAWWGVIRHFGRMIRGLWVAPSKPTDPTLVPADFLIDEAGIVRDVHYGRDIGDHISISRAHAFLKTRPRAEAIREV